MNNEITIDGIVYVRKDSLQSPIVLEDHNFKVKRTKSWKLIETPNGHKLYESPTKDIWEITEGDEVGEQLFTWGAAMRETKKAGKGIPTDEEFGLIKTKKEIPNLLLAGYRDVSGTFYSRGSDTFIWSSSQSASSAWYRHLNSGHSTIYRYTHSHAYGFSVRCLKG